MKTHTTNYFNAFIDVAEDCPARNGEIPPTKAKEPSVAQLQFELLKDQPYVFTSDEVFFKVFAQRNQIPESEQEEAWKLFFSKGQPCFRASPLTKRYGWGVHSDAAGKIAIYGCETEEYRQLIADPALKVVKAMKTSR